jgi:HEAT repeat protein
MEATERSEAIAKRCREHYHPYPETLINAICQYVTGQGTLTQLQQQWKAVGNIANHHYYCDRFIVLSGSENERLDEIDLRILDACIAVSAVGRFLQIIAEQDSIEQAYTYLLSQGVDKRHILKELIEAGNYVNKSEQVTALGKLLLSLMPEHSDEMLNILAEGPWVHMSLPFITLLLTTQPGGYLDLAWQIAQAAQQARITYQLGDYAALLARHDYTRFHEWARQIAGPASPERARITALQALLEYDEAANIDLAVEAFRTPPSYQWDRVELQRLGLEAAYRFDPVQYLPLVEEATVSSNLYLGKHAVDLLKEVDFERARPILQRCVASGAIEVALKALDALLAHEWPERQQYMLSLLSHRSKALRGPLIEWLVKEGERVIEPIAPSLAHPNADARLATVYALRRIGGEQARALLLARLDVEKSLKVKQAILDVVGVATAIASAEAAPASPTEALSSEAEAVFKRVKKPTLPWFDAAQMPELRWKAGEPVPQAVVSYLLYLQSRVKFMEPAERVQQALPLIDRSSSGDLALALFNGWLRQDAPSKQSWLLPLVCSLADERLIPPLRRHIEGWTARSRGIMAERAVAAMAYIESNLALEEINDLGEHGFRWAANNALTAAAERRGITLDGLYDQIVPTLGFDEQGQRVFDYGPRQFILRLHFDQTIQITDNAGKRFMRLPKPGKRDDERKAQAALAAWNMLKKRLPQVVKTQAERLEDALKTRRAWDIARWQALFIKHPLLRSFAVTLVWGVVAAESSGYHYIFRPLEDGSLTDVEDNAVELPAEGQIRMVDPAELDEKFRSVWLQHLTDYEVMQPFSQLNRLVAHTQH